MDDARRDLQIRMDVVSALVAATDDPEKLIRVCASISGDERNAVVAVSAEFGVGEVAARAILDLQVRRFAPRERARMRSELEDLQRQAGHRPGA